MNSFSRRVVVTGVGVEAPAGRYAPGDRSYFDTMLSHSRPPGLMEMEFAHQQFPTHVYGRTPWIDKALVNEALTKEHRRIKRWLGRHSEIAVVAGRSALTHAGIVDGAVGPEGSAINQDRFALSSAGDVQDLDFAMLKEISTAVRKMGDVNYDEALQIKVQIQVGTDRCKDWALLSGGYAPAMALGMLAGSCAGNYNHSTACAASMCSIGEAAWLIWDDRVDVAIAGGVYGRLTPGNISGFISFGEILSPDGPGAQPPGRRMEPARVCRPCATDRNGIIISEGGAYVVLEELEHARRRGAKPLAEVLGYGLTTNPRRIMEPDTDCLARAIRDAMKMAGATPDKIGCVIGHLTGTKGGDAAEACAFKSALGDRAATVPTGNTKDKNGHLILASGALNVATGVLLFEGRPEGPWRSLPNSNLRDELGRVLTDPTLGLHLPYDGEEWSNDAPLLLDTSAGFGGQHGAMVLGPPPA